MRVRDLLPWRDFVIETSLSSHDAALELRGQLAEPTFFGVGGTPFVGRRLGDREFCFRRRIFLSRSSFCPTIRVFIEPASHGGSRVHVRMRLSAGTLASFAVYLGLAIVAFRFPGHGDRTGWVLPILGFVAFGCSIHFAFEAERAERLLIDVFPPPPF